jgi:YD repeat-containing protein
VGPNPNGLQTWAYNGDGNITNTYGLVAGAARTTVYTYSATQPNELMQQRTDGFGVVADTRDGQGNLTSQTSTDPPSSPLYVHRTFGYDALERPIT